MKLTALQRRNLAALRNQRHQGVRVWRSLVGAKLAIVAHLLIVGGAAFYLTQGGVWRELGFALIGFAAGSYIRIVRITIAAKAVWPAFVEIIDWQKVDALLHDDQAPPSNNSK